MLIDWSKEYQDKLLSSDEAAKKVKSGDWVEYAFGLGSANEFDAALARRASELHDIKIRCDIGAYRHHTLEADPSVFTWDTWHVSAFDKAWIHKGLFYSPMKFHELPMMTRKDAEPLNVFVAMVSPMDKHGYFSWGMGNASAMAAHDSADITILEVNQNMPRIQGGGQNVIHITEVDYVIEADTPLLELGAALPSEIESKIAGYITERLTNGCCIQLGIGGVPNAVGTAIASSDLKDIGVHTEMYVDAYLEMFKAGKITGRYKNLDRGKQVFAFALGSKDLYEYVDDNPSTIAYQVDYTNDPKIIAQIDDFVSINACIEVDLYGQVSSESVGTRQISGTGGQLDFVEGAYKSKNGQSFICMASTKTLKDGTINSTIRPTMTAGSIITCPRTATHMIVTEFGVAELKGKSTWERAEALINIAHPDFRDELIREAQAQNIWRTSNR